MHKGTVVYLIDTSSASQIKFSTQIDLQLKFKFFLNFYKYIILYFLIFVNKFNEKIFLLPCRRSTAPLSSVLLTRNNRAIVLLLSGLPSYTGRHAMVLASGNDPLSSWASTTRSDLLSYTSIWRLIRVTLPSLPRDRRISLLMNEWAICWYGWRESNPMSLIQIKSLVPDR